MQSDVPDVESILDSQGGTPSLLGAKMAAFLGCCEPRHPELLSDPLREVFCEATELAEVVRLCAEKGMRHLLSRIRCCSRRDWPNEVFRTRFIKEPHRSFFRSRKRPFSVESQSFFRRFSELMVDLPSDFGHLFEKKSPYREFWVSRDLLFRAAGCRHLSSISSGLAGTSSVGPMGLKPVSLSLAAMVLCKRMRCVVSGNPNKLNAVDSEGSLISVRVSPFDFSSKLSIAPDSLFLSEVAMDGYPIFDHHVVVSSGSGCVFLGERDGVFYFVGENYFDCGGKS